jgi:hypothetical protein
MNLNQAVILRLQDLFARKFFTHFEVLNKIKIIALFLSFFLLHRNLLPWAESVIEFENYSGSFFSSIFNGWSGYATFYQSFIGFIDLNIRNLFGDFFVFNLINSLVMAFVVSESFLEFENKLRLNRLCTILLNLLIFLFFLDFVSHPSIWSVTTIPYLFVIPLLLQFLFRENTSVIAIALFFMGVLSKFHPVFLLFSGVLFLLGRRFLFFLSISIVSSQYYLLVRNGAGIQQGSLKDFINSVIDILQNGNRIILGVPSSVSILFMCMGIGIFVLHSLQFFREKSFCVTFFYTLVSIATILVFSYLSFVNTPGVTLDVLLNTPIKAQYFIYVCFLSLMCLLFITWKINDFVKSNLFVSFFLLLGCFLFSFLNWSNYQLHNNVTTQGVKMSSKCYLYPPTPDWSTQYSNSLDSIWSDCSIAQMYNKFDGLYFTELNTTNFSTLKPELLYVTTEALPQIVDPKLLNSCLIFKNTVNSKEIGFYLGDNLGFTANAKFNVFHVEHKSRIQDSCKILEMSPYSQFNLLFLN